ncbi:MAG: deoxyuridine 5'-triphosphate nucleotidohydrolase [Oscillospiraceae bacterium]|nr:deoxyuridine 5'-triphosphate nucleotidohydrolase [Oscillospiraceae bacterium]
MHRIAEFERVSFTQFKMGAETCDVPLKESELLAAYHNIALPVRATAGSAGYDFFTPFSFSLAPRETITVPTGIRVRIAPGWWLGILPRSGHGFHYRVQLDNTMGVIDSDYYHADNEGHILVKLTSDSLTCRHFELAEGAGFAQGIFLPYGVTESDQAAALRTGGFGSTGE